MSVARIVVGTEGSPGGQAAVAWATELAAQLGPRASVTVVHAFEPLALLGQVAPPYDMPALAATQRDRLEQEWCEVVRAAGVEVQAAFVEDDPVTALARVADDVDADLIVVGARAQSALRGLVLGSTSLKLPHVTLRPVCIVHHNGG